MLEEKYLSFREKIRDFAESVIAPRAEEIDKKEEFPWDVIKKMGENGYMGIPFPKEYGGLGLDTLSYSIGVEEVSRVCGSTGLTMAAHISLGTYPIYLFGNEEQKRRYLPKLVSGKALGAFGLTEPEAGSDAGATKTTAVLSDGFYIVNGTKNFITSGEIAETCVFTAVTDKHKGVDGISSFIVERGTKGFSYGKRERKLGVCGSVTSTLLFQDCRIRKENILGKEGEGFKQFLKILDGGRISIGAMALGIAQAALDASVKYSRERIQFGKTISEFQAIQWMIAEMATEIEAARNLVYEASRMKDAGVPYKKQAAMAKLYASTIGMRATVNAIQIHGGRGYMKEIPLERYFRDVKLCEIGEGTSEIQKILIAREILKGN